MVLQFTLLWVEPTYGDYDNGYDDDAENDDGDKDVGHPNDEENEGQDKCAMS